MARPPEWDQDRPCVECGRMVEKPRRVYYAPTCYACLPPPQIARMTEADMKMRLVVRADTRCFDQHDPPTQCPCGRTSTGWVVDATVSTFFHADMMCQWRPDAAGVWRREWWLGRRVS